jgi:hypothetical protein
MGENNLLPMATGLREEHLAAIRNRAPPPPLSTDPAAAAAAPGAPGAPGSVTREEFAQLMQEYNRQKRLKQIFGPTRYTGGGEGSPGYTSTSRSAVDRASNPGGGLY